MILYERAQFEGELLQLLIELQEQPCSLYDVCIGTTYIFHSYLIPMCEKMVRTYSHTYCVY